MKIIPCCFNIFTDKKKTCWKITNACNLQCEYCFSKSESNNNLTGIDKTIKQLVVNKIDYVIITGGEPLINNQVYRIITELNKNNISCSMCTNATLATDSVCKKLKECGLKKVTISYDDNNIDVFNSLKGCKNAHEMCLEGIKNYVKNGFDITLNTVLQKKDPEYLLSIVLFGIKNGIKRFSFTSPVCKNTDTFFSTEELSSIRNYLEHLEKTYFVEVELCNPNCNSPFCPSGTQIFGVNGDLNISECLVKEYKYGD